MAIYTETKLVEHNGKKFYRATATPEGFFELLKIVFYAITMPKRVQFRMSIDEDYWDANIKDNKVADREDLQSLHDSLKERS